MTIDKPGEQVSHSSVTTFSAEETFDNSQLKQIEALVIHKLLSRVKGFGESVEQAGDDYR